MPKITFTINNQTGEMTSHIEGVEGPACNDVAEVIKKAMGAATREENTAEYHRSPKPQVKLGS